MTPEQNKLQ